MAQVLLLTHSMDPPSDILPALGLLNHSTVQHEPHPSILANLPTCDVILIDGRKDLVSIRSFTQLLRVTELGAPSILILTEGGMAAASADWGIDDIVLDMAGPAELEARLRIAIGRYESTSSRDSTEIRAAGVVIDEASYSARIDGTMLDLTYKEFELLKYLAQHPGHVFTRSQLLHEVWGYDYYGGTRTVDVHIRRLRAKLGSEREKLIGTVRNVGYRFSSDENSTDDESIAG